MSRSKEGLVSPKLYTTFLGYQLMCMQYGVSFKWGRPVQRQTPYFDKSRFHGQFEDYTPIDGYSGVTWCRLQPITGRSRFNTDMKMRRSQPDAARSLFTLIMLLAATVATCFGQGGIRKPDLNALPSGWKVFPTPAEDSDVMHCANVSQQVQVSLSDAGIVEIVQLPRRAKAIPPPELPPGTTLQPGMAGYESLLKTQNGWLMGFDRGEFGGGLWFVDANGIATQLSKENVHGFVETPPGVMIFVGLAHMMLDSGQVLIARDPISADTKLHRLAPLDGAPNAFAKTSPDEALVVTTNGISRITSSGAYQTLTHSTFGHLYPNSILATPEGTIYAGMRLFVVRLVPTSKPGEYTEQWLVPDGCEQFHQEGHNCTCSK